MCHFPPQNTPIFPKQNLLIQTIITNYLKKKFKKNLTADPEFVPKNGPFAPPHQKKKKCFWKVINISLIYLLAPFSPYGPKMAYFPK